MEITISNPPFRLNRQIRAREVLLIDENGHSIGLVPIERALFMGEDRELDVVEVAPDARPPVAKLMDFGKFHYELSKQERKKKAKQQEIDIKEIRLGYKIGEHDRNVRIDRANQFLAKGNKVKVVLKLIGREQMFVSEAVEDILQFKNDITAETTIEQEPRRMGNRIVMILAPKAKNNK